MITPPFSGLRETHEMRAIARRSSATLVTASPWQVATDIINSEAASISFSVLFEEYFLMAPSTRSAKSRHCMLVVILEPTPTSTSRIKALTTTHGPPTSNGLVAIAPGGAKTEPPGVPETGRTGPFFLGSGVFFFGSGVFFVFVFGSGAFFVLPLSPFLLLFLLLFFPLLSLYSSSILLGGGQYFFQDPTFVMMNSSLEAGGMYHKRSRLPGPGSSCTDQLTPGWALLPLRA